MHTCIINSSVMPEPGGALPPQYLVTAYTTGRGQIMATYFYWPPKIFSPSSITVKFKQILTCGVQVHCTGVASSFNNLLLLKCTEWRLDVHTSGANLVTLTHGVTIIFGFPLHV